jgi:DNA polymerase (family 10)
LVICSDAHSPSDFDNLRWGIGEARRGWLTKDDVATAWAWETVRR